MPGKKTDKYRYWLTFLLADLPVGAIFQPGILHITIIPWFVVEIDESKLRKSFNKAFGHIQVFDVRVGEKAVFGPDRDVPVNLIKDAPEIIQLHKLALDWFGQVGARWAVQQPHVGNEYVPHIRYRRGSDLTQGSRLHLDSLTLVRALRSEDGQRSVAERATLE